MNPNTIRPTLSTKLHIIDFIIELCIVSSKLQLQPNFDVSSQYVFTTWMENNGILKVEFNVINQQAVQTYSNHSEIGSPNHEE